MVDVHGSLLCPPFYYSVLFHSILTALHNKDTVEMYVGIPFVPVL